MIDNRIYHTGLYSKDPKEIRTFVTRVNRFNLKNLKAPVLLDLLVFEEGEDKKIPEPHTKFRILFPDKETLKRFWEGNE